MVDEAWQRMGVRIGHADNREALTGCSVVLCEEGAICGMDIRGSAVDTRQTEVLNPLHIVEKIQGILLTGGSAFGLDAAGGVQRYLEERGKGFDTSVARVPIIPTAVIFDLALGKADIRPDAAMGYRACLNATAGPVAEGSVGVGTGATVGKLFGLARAMKGGVGFCRHIEPDGLVVAAFFVVNAFGNVIDVDTGETLAGVREAAGSHTLMDKAVWLKPEGSIDQGKFGNTTLGVIVTNAILSKSAAAKVSQLANTGLARAIYPAHSMFDGDLVFTLATGTKQRCSAAIDLHQVGFLAERLTCQAIKRAIEQADGFGLTPARQDLRR
jgi:L-aminopeptidase/D-esterase-like protein